MLAPVCVPDAPLPIQLPTGRAVEDSLGPWDPVPCVEEAPGSWCQIGSAPTIAATWGVNQHTADLSVQSAFPIKIKT